MVFFFVEFKRPFTTGSQLSGCNSEIPQIQRSGWKWSRCLRNWDDSGELEVSYFLRVLIHFLIVFLSLLLI
jgi:hypothetical protein